MAAAPIQQKIKALKNSHAVYHSKRNFMLITFYKNTNTIKWTRNELLTKICNGCYQCRIKLFFN